VRIDAWFDAICPWTWATSRWLVGCATSRGVEVRWHPYSLTFQNDSPVGPALRALRVVAAVRAQDELAVGPLYTELGRRIHHDGEKADDDLARRVIDFISGVTYALNGFYERVGDKVFLFTPANIIIADEDEIEPSGKGPFFDAKELS